MIQFIGTQVELREPYWENSLEIYNLGYIFEKNNQLERSISLYEQAKQLQDSDRLLTRIETKLTWQYKRADLYRKAVKIWQEMIREKRGGLFPWIELAKYYEHQANDYKSALQLVESAKKFLFSSLLDLNHNKHHIFLF